MCGDSNTIFFKPKRLAFLIEKTEIVCLQLQIRPLRDFFRFFFKKTHVMIDVQRLVWTKRGGFLMEKGGGRLFSNMSRARRLAFPVLV